MKGIKHRNIKFSLEEISRGHLVPHPAQSKATWMRLLRTMSSQGWISPGTQISQPLQATSSNVGLPSVETLFYMGTPERKIKNNVASR